MKEDDVRKRAFAMPLTSPAYPPGPYRFRDREFVIIAYRTDPDKLRALVPLRAEIDQMVGTLDYGPVRVVTGTMGYKHKSADPAAIMASLQAPNYLLKIIPHVDGTPRICELVEYYLEDIELKGAWTGPGALELHPHALAPVAELPVLEIVSATHIIADLTLGLGKVVYDYLE